MFKDGLLNLVLKADCFVIPEPVKDFLSRQYSTEVADVAYVPIVEDTSLEVRLRRASVAMCILPRQPDMVESDGNLSELLLDISHKMMHNSGSKNPQSRNRTALLEGDSTHARDMRLNVQPPSGSDPRPSGQSTGVAYPVDLEASDDETIIYLKTEQSSGAVKREASVDTCTGPFQEVLTEEEIGSFLGKVAQQAAGSPDDGSVKSLGGNENYMSASERGINEESEDKSGTSVDHFKGLHSTHARSCRGREGQGPVALAALQRILGSLSR